jgi:flavin-binding protein dodecin
MTARRLDTLAADLITGLINSRHTAVERLDWATIAHGDGHITDAQLAFYREQAHVDA